MDEILKVISRITKEEPVGISPKEDILAGLLKIEQLINEKNKLQSENSKRVNHILEVIMSLAQLQYHRKATLSEKSDHLDALALGINMLGEELQSSTISLNEKEVLLKEIHHRVKNNLQVISSLLNLQSETITDSHSLEKFKDSQNRVRSMALVHEKLYQSKDLSRINFAEYIESFMDMVNRSYNLSNGRVKLHMDVKEEDNMFSIDTAIPCALMLNELVSNAFKYAFPDGKEGTIHLSFKKRSEGLYSMEVSDDGVGMPEHTSLKNSASLGLQLVDMLAEQLNGSVDFKTGPGTSFIIHFKP